MKNPVSVFFNEIKKLENLLNVVEKEAKDKIAMGESVYPVWPLNFKFDCAEEDCFKRPDGLWEKKEPMVASNGQKHQAIFLWRLATGFYCCAGQPCYGAGDEYQYFTGSEHDKILYTHEDYTFHWKWRKPKCPTRTIWGFQMGDLYYEIQRNGNPVCNSYKKAPLKRFWKDYAK